MQMIFRFLIIHTKSVFLLVQIISSGKEDEKVHFFYRNSFFFKSVCDISYKFVKGVKGVEKRCKELIPDLFLALV